MKHLTKRERAAIRAKAAEKEKDMNKDESSYSPVSTKRSFIEEALAYIDSKA